MFSPITAKYHDKCQVFTLTDSHGLGPPIDGDVLIGRDSGAIRRSNLSRDSRFIHSGDVGKDLKSIERIPTGTTCPTEGVI